jgi:hypothetical protein
MDAQTATPRLPREIVRLWRLAEEWVTLGSFQDPAQAYVALSATLGASAPPEGMQLVAAQVLLGFVALRAGRAETALSDLERARREAKNAGAGAATLRLIEAGLAVVSDAPRLSLSGC